MKNDHSEYFVHSIEKGLFFSLHLKPPRSSTLRNNSMFPLRSCPLLTQALFGLVDETLELRDLQEAEALGDGVEQQETVRPADGGLQRGHGAVLGGRIIKKEHILPDHVKPERKLMGLAFCWMVEQDFQIETQLPCKLTEQILFK